MAATIRFSVDYLSPNAYLAWTQLPALAARYGATIDGELFWGFDDLPHLELFRAGRDQLDRAAWERWAGPSRASAVRTRAPRPPGASGER